MDNHRDLDDLELAAFRSGRTYKEYLDSWVSVGPTVVTMCMTSALPSEQGDKHD